MVDDTIIVRVADGKAKREITLLLALTYKRYSRTIRIHGNDQGLKKKNQT